MDYGKFWPQLTVNFACLIAVGLGAKSVFADPFEDSGSSSVSAQLSSSSTQKAASKSSSDDYVPAFFGAPASKTSASSESSTSSSSSSSQVSLSPAPSSENSTSQTSAAGESTSSLSSESSSASASEQVTTSPAELIELESELARANFEQQPTDENRALLLQSYEKLLQSKCMPQLMQTLVHDGYPSDSKPCFDLLSRTFKLDSSNPIAFCARDGIDSKNCTIAYKRQRVSPFGPPFEPQKLVSGLEAGQPVTTVDTLARFALTIKDQQGRAGAKATEPQKIYIRSLYDRALVISCAVQRLELKRDTSTPPAGGSSDKYGASSNDIKRAIALLEAKPTPTNPPRAARTPAREAFEAKKNPTSETEKGDSGYGPIFFRNRLLPTTCMYFITEGLHFEPDLATAICHRDGFYSPSCIQSMRAARAKALEYQRQAQMSAAQQSRSAGTRPAESPRSKAPGFSTF